MPSKKKVKVFDQYSDAFIYCVNNEIKKYKICKYHTRPNTMRDWVVMKNGQVLKV
jgi:hypothetical protein